MHQIEDDEVKISDFRPIISCTSEMVQDRTWAGYKNSSNYALCRMVLFPMTVNGHKHTKTRGVVIVTWPIFATSCRAIARSMLFILSNSHHCKALNSLICADVPLRNYSLTRMLWPCICPSACQSQAGIVRKWINTRISQTTPHNSPVTLVFWHKDLDEIRTGSFLTKPKDFQLSRSYM